VTVRAFKGRVSAVSFRPRHFGPSHEFCLFVAFSPLALSGCLRFHFSILPSMGMALRTTSCSQESARHPKQDDPTPGELGLRSGKPTPWPPPSPGDPRRHGGTGAGSDTRVARRLAEVVTADAQQPFPPPATRPRSSRPATVGI